MFQRIKALIIIFGILTADFYIAYSVVGVKVAIIVFLSLFLYSFWIGEFIAIKRAKGISLKRVTDIYEREKLNDAWECIMCKVDEHMPLKIKCRVMLVPVDEINAFAYGSSVGVTRGAVNCLDETTMCSVLAHELAHVISLDAVISRLLFAHLVIIISALALTNITVYGVVFLIVLLLCFLGMRINLLTYVVTKGVFTAIKKLGNGIQYLVVIVMQSFMSILSRTSEYRADNYACKLGYAYELEYFLERFLDSRQRQRTLQEVLYATHPPTSKRIARVERFIDQKLQLPDNYS